MVNVYKRDSGKSLENKEACKKNFYNKTPKSPIGDFIELQVVNKAPLRV
jgi:hypothetical protein